MTFILRLVAFKAKENGTVKKASLGFLQHVGAATGLVARNKLIVNNEVVMLSVECFQDALIDSPESSLLEIHRSKISLHHAKSEYDYPTIRLPRTFSKLAGLPTHIYQTVHEGALAFLVVISPDAKAAENSESFVLT